MARKIVITGGKGGCGKTTVTANLGTALAHKSLRVALIDLDMGLNNLDVVMKIQHRVVFDITDVIEGRCRVRQALIQDFDEPTLFVMPSGHVAKRQITVDAVKKVVQRLEDSFDYVLIDCPAGIDSAFRRAVSCADEAIVVVTPHLSGIHDAEKTIECLDKYNLIAVSVVVNRVRGDLVVSGDMPDPFEVFSRLNRTALGVLPENDTVNVSGAFRSVDRRPYDILADNLHCGGQKMFDCVSKYRGFFGRMKSRFKRNA